MAKLTKNKKLQSIPETLNDAFTRGMHKNEIGLSDVLCPL